MHRLSRGLSAAVIGMPVNLAFPATTRIVHV
jgi:hypothetical protein